MHLQNFTSTGQCFDLLKCWQAFSPSIVSKRSSKTKGECHWRDLVSMHVSVFFNLAYANMIARSNNVISIAVDATISGTNWDYVDNQRHLGSWISSNSLVARPYSHDIWEVINKRELRKTAIIYSSVVMQSMASSPFYLLLVVSLNFLSSDTKPISILDNGKLQCFFSELLICYGFKMIT